VCVCLAECFRFSPAFFCFLLGRRREEGGEDGREAHAVRDNHH